MNYEEWCKLYDRMIRDYPEFVLYPDLSLSAISTLKEAYKRMERTENKLPGYIKCIQERIK